MIGRLHDLPSATAENEVTNCSDAKRKISRMRQCIGAKITKLKLIIYPQWRENQQINFRFNHLKTHSKATTKVDHFRHQKQYFLRVIKSNQRRKSNQSKQKEGPEIFLFWENGCSCNRLIQNTPSQPGESNECFNRYPGSSSRLPQSMILSM